MQNAHIEKSAPFRDVTGVILAGGKSSRMGRDKATLQLDGVSLFERLLGVMQGLFGQILVAGDRPDLARPGVVCRPDIHPGCALGGLHTGLFYARTGWVFAAACDMPHPDPAIIRILLERRGKELAVVPRTAHGREPLFALYRKECLGPVTVMLEEGRYRILDLYDRLSVRYVEEGELPPGWERALTNVNTPGEYRRVRRAAE